MNATFRVGGLDIGGANIKAARLERAAGRPDAWRAASVPLEMWRHPDRLETVLAAVGRQLGFDGVQAVAVTMTAELADVFSSKSEGVLFVCRAVVRAFPELAVHCLSLSGLTWIPAKKAPDAPADFAANNWMASALYLAARHSDALFVDTGGTTTDIIPIRGGRVDAQGLTDTDRLIFGELVYTGILRTNPNTLAAMVPLGGRQCRTAAECFSCMADVHLLLGNISAGDYTCPTADGRSATPENAAARLARLVCADAGTLCPSALRGLAVFLCERQTAAIAEAALQVLSARNWQTPPPLLAAGTGAFLAEEVGRRLGLRVRRPLVPDAPLSLAALPALAAASLLAEQLERGGDA
jgi:probable H4MPT-linked C1 transfer pathway protein